MNLLKDPVKIRNLRALGLLIFLLSLGEGMTAPAIPILGSHLGASYALIGFFMTGYSLTYGVMTMVSGHISDRFGRKKVLLWSVGLGLLASVGYCFSPNAGILFFFRTLEGMSRGALWVVLETILADNSTEADRSADSGRFTAAYGLGDMLGCLLGGVLMQYAAFNSVFIFYPIFTIGSLLVALYWITEVPGGHHADEVQVDYGQRKILWAEIKKIWPVCYLFFTYSGFLYSLWGLLSMVASHFKVSYLGIGIIFALFWACRVVSFLSANRLEAKYGRKRVLLIGIIFASVSAAVFLVAKSFILLLVACAIGGIGTGILFTLVIAQIADTISPGYRGFGMGFMEFAGSFGMIAQTALSGIMGQYGGVQLTYLFTLLVCLGGIVITIYFVKTEPATHSSPKKIAEAQ